MELDEVVVKFPVTQNESPPSSEESGGTPEARIITGRDVAIGIAAVILTGSVMVYLHTELDRIRTELSADINEVQTTVQENARGLAVVQTEIKALRRDIERVEDLAKNPDQDADAQTTSGPRTIRRRGTRSPI